MNFLNSIFYKSLVALYKLNIDLNGRCKNILIDAIFEGLVIGKEGLDNAKLSMALDTATDDWLDYWGTFFGVYRMYEEDDDTYRKRIIEEIISPKSTIGALKKGTSRYLKYVEKVEIGENSVFIFEPWTELLKFDERGFLDGSGRMISYEYWNYGIVEISIPDSTLITKGLIDYLNKIKAGGVKIRFSITPNWGIVVDPDLAEKRYHIWLKIYRETMMYARRNNTAFDLMLDGKLDDLPEDDKGGRLDISKTLEGRQTIFWNGVEFNRTYLATGVIRNHLYSGIISIEDMYTLNENMTIEDAIKLENKSFESNRENEGPLSVIQGLIYVD